MNGLPLEFKFKLNGKVVGYGKFDSYIDCGLVLLVWDDEIKKWCYGITVIFDEMCQYTGFKDRNDEKIYFGDNLRISENNLLFTVTIKEGNIFAVHPDKSGFGSSGFYQMELIKEKKHATRRVKKKKM